MNLIELERLIASLDYNEDRELIEFYLQKKRELIKQIQKSITLKLQTDE